MSSSSSLSSSSSSSSTTSSSSDSNSNTSSSSSSSDSSASTNEDNKNENDDYGISSDDSSLDASENSGEREAKGWKGKKSRRDHDTINSSDDDDDDDDDGSLDSSSDSKDTIMIADRESKMLFDADLSSGGSDDGYNENDDGDTGGVGSVDDERRRRRMKKKNKMLRRAEAKRVKKSKKDDAANTIQNHWKRKNKKKGGCDDDGVAAASRSSSGVKVDDRGGEKGKSSTVESPSPEVLRHIRSMSTKSQRRAVHPGLRVKVRFVKRASVQGRTMRRIKWYGGVVTGVLNGGRRIKVHYDDGTNEVSDFPDKDIIVDDYSNGHHIFGVGGGGGKGEGVVGSAFAPPLRRSPTMTDDIDASSDKDEDKGGSRGMDEAIADQSHHRPKGAKDQMKTDDEGDDGACELEKSKKKKKKKKKKIMRKESITDAEGEGGGGSGQPPFLEKRMLGVREEEDNGGGDLSANVDDEDASINVKNNANKPIDSSADMSIADIDGGSCERIGEIPEVAKMAKKEMAQLRYEYPIRDEMSPGEECDDKYEAIAESTSSLFRSETKDPGENLQNINECSPEMEGGESPEDEELQPEEMRDQVKKPSGLQYADVSTTQLKYADKPQDDGPSDEAYAQADQAAGAYNADPSHAANHPVPITTSNENVLRSKIISCRSISAAAAVIDLSPTIETIIAAATTDDKLPSHVSLKESSLIHSTISQPMQEERHTALSDVEESKKKESVVGDESKAQVTSDETPPPPTPPTSMTANADEEAQHHIPHVLITQPHEMKKKRGPLSIRIGLPGAKRKKQMEEEMKLKQQDQSAADGIFPSPIAESSKKKQKISTLVVRENERIGEGTMNDDMIKKSDPSSVTPAHLEMHPIITHERPACLDTTSLRGKEGNDDSLSDGEIKQDGELHKDDTYQMTVDTKKTLEATNEDNPEMKPSFPATKKRKLVIKLNTKKRIKQQDSKVDEETAPFAKGDSESRQNVGRNECLKTSTNLLPTAERINGAAADSVLDDRNPAFGATSPRSDDDRSNYDKILNSTGTSASTLSVLPENGSAADDGKAYSMARSGRKAAKRAAEKIAVKKHKPKKDEKNEKAEEDPWVQCDRCHKWRHLPGFVNVESLPEHWFCELNIYDSKRNNCEAVEQTPKEVAKEKKRAKKLAIMKLQFEHAQTVTEEILEETKPKNKMGSTSPKNGSDKEAEFGLPGEVAVCVDSIDAKGKSITDDDEDVNATPAFKSKAKRGRPRRDDKEKPGKNKDEMVDETKKQEWVQCEKCEKWRRLPPRISAEDLPEVWFCSMNTWDIHLATCTAVEDKHEASPARTAQYSEQSQIPTSFPSSGKLSYRSLIFGSGRIKKNISERMRAQESLFSTQDQDEADMSLPPTVAYANSKVFFNKSLNKTTSFDDERAPPPTSVFDILPYSRVWQELNNNESIFHARNMAAYNAVGYDNVFYNTNGSMNQEAMDTLKAMVYFSLGTNTLVSHKILLDIQCQDWDVPPHWMELRLLCTIDIVTFILDELIKDGLVEMICESKSSTLEKVFYRRRLAQDVVRCH
ncbi:hypothetical protein ACHAXA_008545 [Cyclostephanos tholiformis]|uniref:CW-type domain-containing protein n=1 Tax=Cyclostephanos tholiformis TaxID=382380 RepID=A0ABD3RAQ2_9STRA